MASPSLCVIQIAEIFSRCDVTKSGYELAGGYRLSQMDQRGFSDACPAMTLRELENYLADVQGLRGAKVARSCLPFILPGSASPRETQLAMLLASPRRAGAYGLPRPLLNYPIELDEVAQAMVHSRSCRADMCWPEAKLVVEYDSDFAHTGSDRIASDSARRSALLHVDMRVVGVTRLQMNSRFALDRVVSVLEGQLGMRSRPANEAWRKAQTELWRKIVKSDRYGFRG